MFVFRSGVIPPRCLPAEPVGDISVSDKGVVLFTQGTSQNCVYVDSWPFKPEPLSSSHMKQDQCSATVLSFRHPGMPLAREVVPIGRQPQWDSRCWVSALKSWPQDRRPISARVRLSVLSNERIRSSAGGLPGQRLRGRVAHNCRRSANCGMVKHNCRRDDFERSVLSHRRRVPHSIHRLD